MSVAYLPEAQKKADFCKSLYNNNTRYTPVLDRQSKQMVALNSTLTIYTSWTDQQLSDFEACKPSIHREGILYKQFDPDALLHKYNFTSDQIRWIQNWHMTGHKGHVPAQLSDVIRILLARDNRMAYLDLDMFPVPPVTSSLSQPADLYLKSPCVAVPIWSEERGALEIQNSGFCFSDRQLDYLTEYLKNLIDSKGEEQKYKFYTELGPNVFQHSLQALTLLDPTKFLFTTNNNDNNVPKVRKKVAEYKSEIYWFHLDGHFRGSNIGANNKLGKTFDNLFDAYKPKALE
jgi:hypothetical protein